jgi:hypothetical protein
MFLNVSELAKMHFTPTEIAIAGIVANDFFNGFTIQELELYGLRHKLLFLENTRIIAFIKKMLSCEFGYYEEEEDANNESLGYMFTFSSEFIKSFMELVNKEV